MSDSPHPPAPEKKPCSKCGHPIVELKSSTTIFDIEGVGDGDWTPHTSHLCNLHRENGQLRAEVERYEHRDTPDREPEAWGVRDVENKLIYSVHLKKSAEEFARGYGSKARVVPLFADAACAHHAPPAGALRVAFDIGGVLSKRPDVFRPLVAALQAGGVEVFVVTDMHDHEQSVRFVRSNGYAIPAANVLNSDYTAHGEACKAETVKTHNLHLLVDDFPGYASAVATETDAVSLFTWPDPRRPYYADDFKTDGQEGDFGRRRAQTPVRDASKVIAQCEEALESFHDEGRGWCQEALALRDVLEFLKVESAAVKAAGTIKLVPHGVAPRSAISPGTLAAVDEALQKKPETEHRPGNINTLVYVGCSRHCLEVDRASNGHHRIVVRDQDAPASAPAVALVCMTAAETRDLRNALGEESELQRLQDSLYKLRRRIETGLLPVHDILEALRELR